VVASREADTAGQINALENTKIQLEISKLTGALARDKILLDGNAIAPAIYKQEQEEYAYELKLRDAMDEFYLGRIVLGQSAIFTSDGRDYEATVAKIYPQVTNGTFRIDLHFENPPQGIHTGQAFDIKLELGRAATALMLPNGPFYQETGGNWIFVVAPDGRYATRRTVRLGRRNPEHVEVVDGLAPGEKVIVSGAAMHPWNADSR
jgi:multidrug efflux pump subunit AcrA (membrane-fusion protein)